MTGRPHLGDTLALKIVEHGPSAGSDLARLVGVRKQAVLRELREDARFEQLGHGRGSRWRLAGNRYDPRQEPLGTEPEGGSRSEVTRAEFDLLRRQVEAIEQQLAANAAHVRHMEEA